MWNLLVSIVLTYCLGSVPTEGANILAFLPSSSPSHLIIEAAVVKEMAQRNHNVTIVSSLPLKSEWLHPSMTYIQLDSGTFDMNLAIAATRAKGFDRFHKVYAMFNHVAIKLAEILDDPKMQELINNPGNHFDLMLFGYIPADFLFGLAEHFDCPIALLWPNTPLASILKLIGSPLEISYTTVMTITNLETDNRGFLFRLKNVMAIGVDMAMQAARDHFSKSMYDNYAKRLNMRDKWNYLLSIALTFSLPVMPTEGANILAFLPSFSPSHLIMPMAVVREMAEHNHNVTVVSVLPLKSEWLHPSMTHIQLDSGTFDMNLAISATNSKGLDRLRKRIEIVKAVPRKLAEILDDPKMQELMNNRGNHFELMLFGYLSGDFFFGIAEHFDCPIALLWPNVPMSSILNLIGSPLEMSYAVLSLMNLQADNNGFSFRLKNVLAYGVDTLMTLMHANVWKSVYEQHFPSDKYVSYEKAKERVSMVLFSHHFSEKPVRPLVPGLIEIGGIHLNDQPNPLPEDIEAFVSTAEHGVIFFSLGTNVKVDHLQPQALDKIYNVLSKLPQKVLWKCEDESKVPGNSSNILFRKWLPQGDILGHPNIKLFFGHGGKGGITEAKFYGVPIVGLPVFGDQPMNMEEVVMKGYGLTIQHDESLTEEVIHQTITEVMQNKTYAHNVKTFSNLYRDRPLKVKDNAVYWLEYLIRYKGAPHLQSPLKTMSFVEATNLDVFVFELILFVLIAQIVKYMTKFGLKLICRAFGSKSKRD